MKAASFPPDLKNGIPVYAKTPSHVGRWRDAALRINFKHISVRQSPGCASRSALENHVPSVGFHRPQKQVRWIHTAWIVAAMKYASARRDATVSDLPRDTAGYYAPSGSKSGETSVAMRQRCDPWPALIRSTSIDLFPETCDVFFIHELTPRGSRPRPYSSDAGTPLFSTEQG
jgi:hypothetical protein